MRIGPVVAILATTLLTTAASASDVRILTLPNSVLGAWAPNADACKGSGKERIEIESKTHKTEDTTCDIAWITVTASRDGPVYSARSICVQTKTGKKLEPSYLVVSPRPDNRLLVRLPNASLEGQLVTYQKC
jgi:hypothetical protein